jgi:hypothetical protein
MNADNTNIAGKVVVITAASSVSPGVFVFITPVPLCVNGPVAPSAHDRLRPARPAYNSENGPE